MAPADVKEKPKGETGETKGASKVAAKAEASFFETWISVNARLRVVIVPSETIFNNNGMITKPGLTVQFEGGEYRIDTRDPNYGKIVKRFRDLPRFKSGQLVCAQDLLKAGKRVDHALIGKNVRSALKTLGIHSKAQLERGLELMGVNGDEVVTKLTAELEAKAEEVKAAKVLADEAEAGKQEALDAAAAAEAALEEYKKKHPAK